MINCILDKKKMICLFVLFTKLYRNDHYMINISLFEDQHLIKKWLTEEQQIINCIRLSTVDQLMIILYFATVNTSQNKLLFSSIDNIDNCTTLTVLQLEAIDQHLFQRVVSTAFSLWFNIFDSKNIRSQKRRRKNFILEPINISISIRINN